MNKTATDIRVEAIRNLVGTQASFSINEDNIISNWGGGVTQPSQDIVNTEVERVQAEYTNAQYQRDRAEAYPSLADQADMQFHDAVDGTTTWKDAIQAVKDANPKPV